MAEYNTNQEALDHIVTVVDGLKAEIVQQNEIIHSIMASIISNGGGLSQKLIATLEIAFNRSGNQLALAVLSQVRQEYAERPDQKEGPILTVVEDRDE